MPRPLLPVVARGTGLIPALAAAIEGTGPAVLPLPDGFDGDRLRAAMRPDEPVPDDVAVVIATSGSTGVPKGVLLTANALRDSARATHDRLGGPGQWLLALPVSRVAGLQVLVRSLEAGTSPVVLGGLDEFAAAAARLDPATRRYAALVPTQLLRLLDAGVDLSPYDAILVGGAAAPGTLLSRARAAGARVVTTYGMTETCGGCVYDGVPLDGVRVEVDGAGRIRLGGPMIARGYRVPPDDSPESFENGWFRTADLGRLRDDGTLEVLGRADDVIVSGGVNVAPAAVEEILVAHPRVRECAVSGRSDPEWGQRVVAYVVTTDPADPPTLAGLRSHVTARLGGAAAPRELVLVDTLPTLPNGKIDRSALHAGFDDGPAAGERA
jgi:O-succinylbenzoic acid--CoA ligase